MGCTPALHADESVRTAPELASGEFLLVGDLTTGEVALHQSGDRAAAFVATGPATCIDCVDIDCGVPDTPTGLVRTVQVPLAVTLGGPDDEVAYGLDTLSSANFLPFDVDFEGSGVWTPTAPADAISVEISGSIPICGPFSYRFGITREVRRIFVTESVSTGDFGADPVEAADATCGLEATEAGLDGTWAAWFSSDASDDPESRFIRSEGPYVLVDGTTIASDYDDLVDGALLAPIDLTASGTSIFDSPVNPDGYTWTGTNADGTAATATCNGWTTAEPEVLGASGASDTTDSAWSNEIDDTCNAPYALICVQQ